jgi:hypothetical protein
VLTIRQQPSNFDSHPGIGLHQRANGRKQPKTFSYSLSACRDPPKAPRISSRTGFEWFSCFYRCHNSCRSVARYVHSSILNMHFRKSKKYFLCSLPHPCQTAISETPSSSKTKAAKRYCPFPFHLSLCFQISTDNPALGGVLSLSVHPYTNSWNCIEVNT